jgi:hypothetical protein
MLLELSLAMLTIEWKSLEEIRFPKIVLICQPQSVSCSLDAGQREKFTKVDIKWNI